MSFSSFLDRLKMEHCGKCDCENLVSKCVVKQCIDKTFPRREWCPLCDGYWLGERKLKEGTTSELDNRDGIVDIYEGGIRIQLRKDGFSTGATACKCKAGDVYYQKGMARFDFDLEGKDLCYKGNRSVIIERQSKLIKENRLKDGEKGNGAGNFKKLSELINKEAQNERQIRKKD